MYHVYRADHKGYLIMLTEEHEKLIVQMLLVITWKGLWFSEVNIYAGFSVDVVSEAFGTSNGKTLL